MNIACTDQDRYLTNKRAWTDEVVKMGFSHMEIAVSKLPESFSEQEEILAYALSRGLSLNLHAPYGINNISSSDELRRAASIANVKHTIDLAAKYRLGTVTFHPGRCSDDRDPPEENWKRMMDVIEDLAGYAKEKKVFLGIENMERRPYELVFTVEDLNRFAPFGEHNPYFGVTIDFAHYASHPFGLPDLNKLKLPIHNVHLSQIVNGVMHSSLIRGNDAPDLKAVCRLLADYGYNRSVVLELDNVSESRTILQEAEQAAKR